ncbi:MAG: SusF/SusE family outer membrane protein [Bacteroidota bacterium]
MQKINVKSALLLLAATMIVFSTTSCNDDEDVDSENPKLVWVSPEFSGSVMFDEDITVGFTDNVNLASASFTITSDDGVEVGSASGTLSGNEGELTWTNDGTSLKEGGYTINATVADASGNTNAASNKFSVTEPNASGFESNFAAIYFRGSPNSWGATEMELAADNTWEIDSLVMNSAATTEFKLANTDNWTNIDWGAEEGTGVAALSGTMALKEVTADVDEDGNKIDDTEMLVRGANENMKLDGTVLEDGENFYKLTFNDETFAYTLESQGPTGNSGPAYLSIGLIGFATTGTDDGWADGADIAMYSSDLVNYSVAAYLYEGDIKFRADGAWTFNWGGAEFPAGTAVDGGDNIQVSPEGTYYVTFTDADESTYAFTPVESIGLIGDATGSWEQDQDMMQGEEDKNLYSITLDLVVGEIKFRANDAWDINWGGAEGETVPGGSNIAIAEAGNYTLQLHTTNQTYTITKN